MILFPTQNPAVAGTENIFSDGSYFHFPVALVRYESSNVVSYSTRSEFAAGRIKIFMSASYASEHNFRLFDIASAKLFNSPDMKPPRHFDLTKKRTFFTLTPDHVPGRAKDLAVTYPDRRFTEWVTVNLFRKGMKLLLVMNLSGDRFFLPSEIARKKFEYLNAVGNSWRWGR